MRLPSYLKRSRHGIFYLRRRLPAAFGAVTRSVEVAMSLRTRNPKTAVTLSRVLAVQVEAALAGLRTAGSDLSGGSMTNNFDPALRMVGWVTTVKSKLNEVRIEVDPHDPVDHERGADLVLRLLRESAALVGDPQQNGAARAPSFGPASAPAPEAPPVPSGCTPSVRVSIEHSLKINESTRRAKTTEECRSQLSAFAAWLEPRGIASLAQVTTADIGEYKLHLAGTKHLTPKTINKRLSTIATLFKDARQAGHFPNHLMLPTTGHQYRKRAVAKQVKSWLPFTSEDLERIFEPTEFMRLRKPHEYWVPLLQLHQGMRVSEASQLRTDDIVRNGDQWVLRVSDDAEHTSLKSIASKRTVPLHPALLGLGLAEYCEDVRALLNAEGFLFPYLNERSVNGFGDVPGSAVNEYLKPVVSQRSSI